jgi:hypothetical protein
VKIKGYVVVACLTAFVSWLIFSPHDETPEGDDRSREPAPGNELRTQPREPEAGPGEEPYGIAGRYAPRRTPPSRGYEPGRWTAAPAYPPSAPGPDAMERFSFRPLTERELKRIEQERTAPGYYPESVSPFYPPQPYSRAPRGPEPSSETPGWSRYPQADGPSPWYGPGYGLRPDRRGGDDSTPWYGDYPARRGHGEERNDALVPWSNPTSPQWGSRPPDWVPPAERMYPSLLPFADRKLTAR